jgi:archaemetzincin
MRLTLKPFGPVAPEVLEHLRVSLPDFDEVVVAPAAALPAKGFDPRREQRLASSLFPACLAEPGTRVLGVTEADLYETGLNFVFGYSQPDGRAAVISLARLHDADSERFLDRCVKEAVHEIGHTLGLSHDEDHPRCVMRFSHNLEETDRKGRAYCAECTTRARVTLKRLRT